MSKLGNFRSRFRKQELRTEAERFVKVYFQLNEPRELKRKNVRLEWMSSRDQIYRSDVVLFCSGDRMAVPLSKSPIAMLSVDRKFLDGGRNSNDQQKFPSRLLLVGGECFQKRFRET